MGKKVVPLTEKEKYVAKKCFIGYSCYHDAEDKRSCNCLKNVEGKTRKLLKFRADKPTVPAWRVLVEKLRNNKFETFADVQSFQWEVTQLSYAKGSIVGDYVEALMKVEDLSEDEVRRMNVLEAM